jgi:hypothetical protein
MQNLRKDGAHIRAFVLGCNQLQEQRIRHLPTSPLSPHAPIFDRLEPD